VSDLMLNYLTPSYLLECTVRVSIILAIALLAVHLLRSRSAALRHWILVVAMVAASLVPLLTPLMPHWSPMPIVTIRDGRVSARPRTGPATGATISFRLGGRSPGSTCSSCRWCDSTWTNRGSFAAGLPRQLGAAVERIVASIRIAADDPIAAKRPRRLPCHLGRIATSRPASGGSSRLAGGQNPSRALP